mgnify:CR=1 FL=1
MCNSNIISNFASSDNQDVGDFVGDPMTIERNLFLMKKVGVFKCEGKNNNEVRIVSS